MTIHPRELNKENQSMTPRKVRTFLLGTAAVLILPFLPRSRRRRRSR